MLVYPRFWFVVPNGKEWRSEIRQLIKRERYSLPVLPFLHSLPLLLSMPDLSAYPMNSLWICPKYPQMHWKVCCPSSTYSNSWNENSWICYLSRTKTEALIFTKQTCPSFCGSSFSEQYYHSLNCSRKKITDCLLFLPCCSDPINQYLLNSTL